jgi:hypothetical protein
MDDAEKFINKHQLLNSSAHASWCYLKAAGAEKSYNIVKQELCSSRDSLAGYRAELTTVTDKEYRASLVDIIKNKSDSIKADEGRLQTYSYDHYKSLGTAYSITIQQTLTSPYVFGSLAVVAALVSYSLRNRARI